MRVAAVALVLIVGAAVVLAFANTLNSWVLGGLLGGLAAILLSIPISLTLFSLLARRHDARQRSAHRSFEAEPDFAEEVYDDSVIYDAEGYPLPDEDFSEDPRSSYLPNNRRLPVSGYLALPPAGHDRFSYEDPLEQSGRQDLRNYPRQPRFPARSLARDDDETRSQPRLAGSRRHPSTRSLAEHQSAALRMARQEAQQELARRREESGPRSRRSQEERSPLSRRPDTSRSLRPQSPASRRPVDDFETGSFQRQDAQSSWEEEEDFARDFSTEQLRERYQHYPRRPDYPRQPRSRRAYAVDPWTGSFEDEDEQEDPLTERARRDPDRVYGNLRNPLVRRAPYLYDDDPLREELARQLENGRPITRRSSRYEQMEDDE